MAAAQRSHSYVNTSSDLELQLPLQACIPAAWPPTRRKKELCVALVHVLIHEVLKGLLLAPAAV